MKKRIKNWSAKLRVQMFIFYLHLKDQWYKITTPFRECYVYVTTYFLFKKIDRESQDNWEKHVKIRELINEAEEEKKQTEFLCLKTDLLGCYMIVSVCAEVYSISQEDPKEINDLTECRKDFHEAKNKAIKLIDSLNNNYEIQFDEEIKKDFIDWNFEDCKKSEEIERNIERFSSYLRSLDI